LRELRVGPSNPGVENGAIERAPSERQLRVPDPDASSATCFEGSAPGRCYWRNAVALDYKTLQETAASQRPYADDYCPECGRPWRATRVEKGRVTVGTAWSCWLLVAVGMYLLVVYGPRAWSTVPTPVTTPGYRTVVNCWLAGTEQDHTDCDPTKVRVAAGLGLVWCVVGLGAIARRAVPRKRQRGRSGNDKVVDPRSGNPNPVAGLARGICALTVMACQASFVLLVILAGYIGLVRLVEGVEPSGAFVVQTFDRALGVVALALDAID
jgi:hypothetical protein